MPQFINIFELARRGETIEGEVAVKDLPNLLGFTATENGTLRFVATGLGERRGLPAVDLDKWVEEEAILALPRMVVHDACEEKREWSDGEEPQEEKRPNPFAALAALKK